MTVMTLTESTLDDSLTEAPQPLLIDFWTEDCIPCRALAPVLEELAEEHSGRLRFGKVKLDNAPGLARRFEIMAIPTLIVFVDGRLARRITEVTTKAELVRELREFLTET